MTRIAGGATCTYCKRILESRSSSSPLAHTLDHIVAKSHGGRTTVRCCRKCNSIKGNMTYETWLSFMIANPEWWNLPQYERYGYQKHDRQKPAKHKPSPPEPALMNRRPKSNGAITYTEEGWPVVPVCVNR